MKIASLSTASLTVLSLWLVAGFGAPAGAAGPDQVFFQSARGNWSGPGEIVAGKYKGTKFTCNFTGSTPPSALGMTLDGGCRVGVFLQKMSATVEARGDSYGGTFMDGAEGKGLDIVSGNVVDASRIVVGINRKQLNGTMQARMADENTMNVTVSVQVENQLVPVIGVSLKRVDGTTVGSIAK